MLDFGALVCKPTKPRCIECPINSVCDYYQSILHKKTTDDQNQGFEEYDRREVSTSPLRQLRRERGLSQEGLARKAGVTKLTIINIETGRTKPRSGTIAKIALALGVPADHLN